MVDTRLSDLATGAALSATDLFYNVQTVGVGGVKSTGAQVEEFTRDTVANFIVAGTDISVVHDDPGNTLTISYTGTAYTDEDAQDAVGNILTDTATIDFTYDDVTPTITADVIDASIGTAKLADGSVTYAKIQDIANQTH